jgi:hypothetical protein
MGFNKRYISEKMINEYISSQQSLEKLFNADAFIFTDEISNKVYKWFCDGLTIDNIKDKINEYHESRTR